MPGPRSWLPVAGNVRELRNVVERVMLLEDGPVITAVICRFSSRPKPTDPLPNPYSRRKPCAQTSDDSS